MNPAPDAKDFGDSILVTEIFGPTIAGEGATAGTPTVFVRTGGCDSRCTWCDSLFSVVPTHKEFWKPHTPLEILARVNELTKNAAVLITLSGGNPALQPMGALIDLGQQWGHTFTMETQGTVCKPWFRQLDQLVLSPKPPSSLMKFHGDRLENCLRIALNGAIRPRPQVSLKVVVMDEPDYEFARMIYRNFAREYCIPMYLTPGNHTPPTTFVDGKEMGSLDAYENIPLENDFDQKGVMARAAWLVERVAADRWFEVKVIPQLHTLIWQNKRGH